MDDICYVKLKFSLRTMDLEKKLTDAIMGRIKSLPNHIDLRLDSELILFVCNLVENTVFNKSGKKKKDSIDKKRMVIKVLDSIFTYSELEKKYVDQKVEFLHTHDMIAKVPLIKKCSSIAWHWVKKKLL